MFFDAILDPMMPKAASSRSGALMIAAAFIIPSCGRPRDEKREPPTQTSVTPHPSMIDGAVVDAQLVLSTLSDPTLLPRLDAMEPAGPAPRPIRRKHRRGDCKTEYAPRPKRDPNPMCRVDGGTFMYGGGEYLVTSPNGSQPEKVPARSVTLRPFFIDQFEVTVAQTAAFLNAHGNVCDGGIEDLGQQAGGRRPPYSCVELTGRFAGIDEVHGRFVVRTGQEHWPQGYLSWEGAVRYCAWVGKQVPSSGQWEYAARHDADGNRDSVFPWGDIWKPHAVACKAADCDAPSKNSYDPVAVGQYDGTRGRMDTSSPWGPHDMTGGAGELVFDCTDPELTCAAGAPCTCRALLTSSDGAPSVAWLRSDHRIDATALGFGLSGVRCVLPIR